VKPRRGCSGRLIAALGPTACGAAGRGVKLRSCRPGAGPATTPTPSSEGVACGSKRRDPGLPPGRD
jgi:hypothetical protein